MAILFIVLFFLLNLGLIIGFFRPEWVLYKLDVKKDVSRVLVIYGGMSIATVFVYLMLSVPGGEDPGELNDFSGSEYESGISGLAEREFKITEEDHESDTDDPASQSVSGKTEHKSVPETVKREIRERLSKIDRVSAEEARDLNPAGPGDFSNGDDFILIKKTQVLLDSKGSSDGERKINLPPGSWLKFLNINEEKDNASYSVEIFTPDGVLRGTGRITRTELLRQLGNVEHERQLQKQIESELKRKYRRELLQEYEITAEQLRDIRSEIN